MIVTVKNLFDFELKSVDVSTNPGNEVLVDDKSHKELSIDDFVVAKYVGRSSCGFRHNHKYLVKLVPKNSNDSRTTVIGIRDDYGNDIDAKMHFSSATSANKFFRVGTK